jgi:ferredoxin
MSKYSIEKFWVNEDECLSCAECINQAPLVFEFVEGKDGVQIKAEFNYHHILAQTDNIIDAAFNCCVSAIYIELDNGEMLDCSY